jgi:hypothetical protein
LFLVGMGRSGTTLLRDLIAQHPAVSMPGMETKFIPSFIEHFGENPDFSTPDARNRLMAAFSKTLFVANSRNDGVEPSLQSLRDEIDFTSWSTICRDIVLRFSGKPGADVIWGDKTPGYHKHMTLFRQVFPGARFVHITRDPRDVALSFRKTFGRSVLLTAHLWQETLAMAREQAGAFPEACLEVRYEDLTEDVEGTLRNICEFAEIEFDESLTRLSSPTLAGGDVHGRKEVVAGNMGKFRAQLTDREIQRIEEVAYPMMIALGYTPDFAEAHRPLTRAGILRTRATAFIGSYRSYIEDRGFLGGIKYRWRSSRERI